MRRHKAYYNYQRASHPFTSSLYTVKNTRLGPEVFKNRARIQTNTRDKIAIIKQQQLKQQKHQNESRKPNKSHLHEIVFKKDNTSSESALHFFENTSTANFQIPLLPVRTGSRVRGMKLKEIILENNHDFDHQTSMNSQSKMTRPLHQSHPFLDNNDLVDPDIIPEAYHQNSEDNRIAKNNYSDKNQEEGHFTLINHNNEKVDIRDEDEGLTPPNLSLVSNKNISTPYVPDISLFNNTKNNNFGRQAKYDSTKQYHPNLMFGNNLFSSATSASNSIKVIRLKGVNKVPSPPVFASTNALLPTASKTMSMLLVQNTMEKTSKKTDHAAFAKPTSSHPRASSSINSTTLSLLKLNKHYLNRLNGKKQDNLAVAVPESIQPLSQQVKPTIANEAKLMSNSIGLKNKFDSELAREGDQQDHHKMKMSMTSSSSHGVIKKVHAHVSHCPKLQNPAEIICDIHIREDHGHPNPQLTVGWRRKFYNSTQPDILLVSNMTQIYEEIMMQRSSASQLNDKQTDNGSGTSVAATIIRGGEGNPNPMINKDNLEEFHDKFNVTLAPGISPMLRSVLMLRSVTAPDCGDYQCEVTDGVYTLSSETLLFLCH